MSERAVGLRHLVGVLALFDGAALVLVGIHQLAHQPLRHGHPLLGTGVGDDPADREQLAPLRRNLDRHLIGGSADAPGPQERL